MNQRGLTPPRGGGKRPRPHSRAEQCGRLRRGRARARVLHTGRSNPIGPSGARSRAVGPTPAQPQRRDGKWTPTAFGRVHTHTGRHAWHTLRGALVRPPRRFEDPGQRLRGWPRAEEGGRRRPPGVLAWRLPDRGAALSPPRAALRLSPPPEHPRLPPAGLAGGPADTAPSSPAPASCSHPRPAPGMRAGRLPAAESRRGWCCLSAGRWARGREGRFLAAVPHRGPWVPRPP